MKIAYMVPYVPNLIRTRSYNFINQLTSLGNEVTVFTLGSGMQDQRDAELLYSKVSGLYYQEHPVWHSLWNSIKALPSLQPLQTVYSWNANLANRLVKSLSGDRDRFDIVHVEHLRGSRYGRFVKSRFPQLPVIWDSVDCISYLFSQASTYSTSLFGKLIPRFELPRTKNMEGKLITEFDHVLVTSDVDRNELLELAPPASKSAPVSVLANGVDLEYFFPNTKQQRDMRTLVFSGKMSYHANVSMAKYLVSEIMPRIWENDPNVRLIIVGKDPTADVRALGADSRVEVTGTVDDIRPFLWSATVAVIPLIYGAGIQNKVLEAMACGTPVVTTSNALSSLHVTPGRDLLIGDGVAEFSGCVNKLLHDRELQYKIGSSGLSYVKGRHNWIDITEQLLIRYDETIKMKGQL